MMIIEKVKRLLIDTEKQPFYYRVYSVEREDEELERNSKPRAMRVGVRRVIQ